MLTTLKKQPVGARLGAGVVGDGLGAGAGAGVGAGVGAGDVGVGAGVGAAVVGAGAGAAVGAAAGTAVGAPDGSDVGAGVYETSKPTLSEAQDPSAHASVNVYELTAALPGTTCECEPSLSMVSLAMVLPSLGSWTLATTDVHDEPSPR